MSTLEKRLEEFDKLPYANYVTASYSYDNFGKKMINWKTWTLKGYNNNNHLICEVYKSESDNGTKYIKFLNELYDYNYKISSDSISTIRNHPDKFMDESLENMLSDSKKKQYFTDYCKMAYLKDNNSVRISFNEYDIISMKSKSDYYKSIFCKRLGITMSYLNNKLSLY